MRRRVRIGLLLALAAALLAAGAVFHGSWVEIVSEAYGLATDRRQLNTLISAAGFWAPGVFVLLQALQVILAPVPGEATGFIGGYLFGAAGGFFYSTLGLTLGSWINFLIGRWLGLRYVRKFVSPQNLAKFDGLLKRQGVILVFVLFLFPGFPKDLLSLLLGLSAMPLKLFLLLSTFGRMPGTLALSLQGALVYEARYGFMAALTAVFMVLIVLCIMYRESVYRWAGKLDS